MKITEVYITAAGDPSVGIQSESAMITGGDFLLDLDVLDPDDRAETLREFKACLEQTFSSLWGEPATVSVQIDGKYPGE